MQFIAHVLQMFRAQIVDDCTLHDGNGNGWSVSAANNFKSNWDYFEYFKKHLFILKGPGPG